MNETFNAYYYHFEATGVDEVDSVLREVAFAGKAYHNTEDWNRSSEYVMDGETCQQRIQDAANKAAESVRSKTS